MSRAQPLLDDPVFLRSILGCTERMRQELNRCRSEAVAVADLLAIAETSDWLDAHESPVRRRLDRAETRERLAAHREAQAQAVSP